MIRFYYKAECNLLALITLSSDPKLNILDLEYIKFSFY